MPAAKTGDAVKVHYTGSLTDGTQFDSSLGREPLEFVIGSGNLIDGFEQAVVGMALGDRKTVTIPAHRAYGTRRDELIQDVPRAAIPEDIDLTAGMVLNATGPEGRTLSFTVVEWDDDRVKIDGNHPLAGRDLTFALELVEIA